MIDLSYKPKKNEPEETPVGVMILAFLPFVLAFWFLIEAGL